MSNYTRRFKRAEQKVAWKAFRRATRGMALMAVPPQVVQMVSDLLPDTKFGTVEAGMLACLMRGIEDLQQIVNKKKLIQVAPASALEKLAARDREKEARRGGA